MDKPEILDLVRRAINDARIGGRGGSDMITVNTLHALENRLLQDIEAETTANLQEVVADPRCCEIVAELSKVARECGELKTALEVSRRDCKTVIEERNALQAQLDQIKTAVVECGRCRPPSDYSNLVEENARLKNRLREAIENRDSATTIARSEQNQRFALLSENEGLESDLRKCQAELDEVNRSRVTLQAENDTLKAELSAASQLVDASIEQRLAVIESKVTEMSKADFRFAMDAVRLNRRVAELETRLTTIGDAFRTI